jgi:hypothetical protein
LSKLAGEQLCDAAVQPSDLRCISLRPAWVQDAASYATDLGPVIRARPPRGVAGWPYIDATDLAGAIPLATESELPGHEALFTAAPDTIGGCDLHAAWRAANPGAVTELRPVPRPDASGIASAKAQRLLGWRPARGWRDYLTETGEPRQRRSATRPGGRWPTRASVVDHVGDYRVEEVRVGLPEQDKPARARAEEAQRGAAAPRPACLGAVARPGGLVEHVRPEGRLDPGPHRAEVDANRAERARV